MPLTMCPRFNPQEVFPEAGVDDEGAPAGDDMMLLSFEEFKGIMEDYDVSDSGGRCCSWCSCEQAAHTCNLAGSLLAVQLHVSSMDRMAPTCCCSWWFYLSHH
jgi:hypothetical protein